MGAPEMHFDEERVLRGIHHVIVSQLKIECEALRRETGIIDGGLQLGSLQLIELVVGLEGQFGVSLDAEVLVPENFVNAGTVCDLVRRVAVEKRVNFAQLEL